MLLFVPLADFTEFPWRNYFSLIFLQISMIHSRTPKINSRVCVKL
ncbi:unnamed protein product [Arabidopsis halleri]